MYELPVISREEFDRLHTFVRAVLDQGRQRFKMELATMTSYIAVLPNIHWDYLRDNDARGVSMGDLYNPELFHVWINPIYNEPVFKFYMTLIHELMHGYVGMQYNHSAHWRRWFYRTLWHVIEAGLMPKPEDALKWVCCSVEYTYNKRPNVDPMLTILEALHKAEDEHETIKANYLRRLNA